jgi:hypothetical protein
MVGVVTALSTTAGVATTFAVSVGVTVVFVVSAIGAMAIFAVSAVATLAVSRTAGVGMTIGAANKFEVAIIEARSIFFMNISLWFRCKF